MGVPMSLQRRDGAGPNIRWCHSPELSNLFLDLSCLFPPLLPVHTSFSSHCHPYAQSKVQAAAGDLEVTSSQWDLDSTTWVTGTTRRHFVLCKQRHASNNAANRWCCFPKYSQQQRPLAVTCSPCWRPSNVNPIPALGGTSSLSWPFMLMSFVCDPFANTGAILECSTHL